MYTNILNGRKYLHNILDLDNKSTRLCLFVCLCGKYALCLYGTGLQIQTNA